MNRVEWFFRLRDLLIRDYGHAVFSLQDQGNLAMAVQALKDDARGGVLEDTLKKCAAEGKKSDGYYHILWLTKKDWDERIAPGRDELSRRIMEQKWEEKKAQGNRSELSDWILTVQYRDYPDYFKALDSLHAGLGG